MADDGAMLVSTGAFDCPPPMPPVPPLPLPANPDPPQLSMVRIATVRRNKANLRISSPAPYYGEMKGTNPGIAGLWTIYIMSFPLPGWSCLYISGKPGITPRKSAYIQQRQTPPSCAQSEEPAEVSPTGHPQCGNDSSPSPTPTFSRPVRCQVPPLAKIHPPPSFHCL